MVHWIASYVGFEILVIAAAVAVSLWRSHRRRHPRPIEPPPGFERTEERFVDPTTRVVHVVWFNPQTGERRYQPLGREEGGGPAEAEPGSVRRRRSP